MDKRIIYLVLFFQISFFSFAQSDTTRYPWPVAPVNTQKNVSGTFGEYRSTSINGHYHNGTDIPASAGTPVLAVLSGVVAAAYHDGSTGYDSYVRIRSTINGQSKNITYYHTIPLVSAGQNIIAGQQISTIAVDHIHLMEYKLGETLTNSHLNSLRPDGGLINYNDSWKPHIRYVKFLVDNSSREIPASGLGSRVDIIAHVEEVNGTTASALNNGTYKIGYKILSADNQTIVYNPPDNGMRYEYYNIPSDQYVNLNYYRNESSTNKHVYIVTNGSGASGVMSTQIVANSYWDVNQFPYGPYSVMVFTQDSRGNGDTVYIPVITTNIDLIPPSPPVLKYVKYHSAGQARIAWTIPPDSDLLGFRLFKSEDGENYSLYSDESVLNSSTNSLIYNHSGTGAVYFKLYAVDTAYIPNLSIASDAYGIRLYDSVKILIVDGFDRFGGSGSWNQPFHDFVRYFGESFNLPFESCSNDEIINGGVNLNNYNTVLWISGDESTADEVFNSSERLRISSFLQNGGKLFVSGSEIAWDLEGSSTATSAEIQFLRNYLKAKFVSDNSNIKNVVTQPPFPAFTLGYGNTSLGSPYPEDYPDVIDTLNGSIHILRYSSSAAAGIAYSGTFGNSVQNGQVVYFGFPFETIQGKESRTKVMSAVLTYFGYEITNYGYYEEPLKSNTFSLFQNYPNPFNPETRITFSISEKSLVKLKVYDLLGREIKTLINEEKNTGEYTINFNAGDLASGVYIYMLEAGEYISSKKLILLK
jgi:hypothetical protein